MSVNEPDALGLVERILSLLDEGRRSSTYKLAVLNGLMDLCMELADPVTGRAPDMVTTRQLAAKIIELYWSQTADYFPADVPHPQSLRQGGSRGQDAEIVTEIRKFRAQLGAEPNASIARAHRLAPGAWQALLDLVEWKLIEMPLPRLQRLGNSTDDFLYRIHWDDSVKKGTVSEYLRGFRDSAAPNRDIVVGGFDNRIELRPGVGDALVRLNAVLRPLVQRKWAQMVAEMNGFEESRLESFLFGAERVSLERVRGPLRLLHRDECFYCESPLRDVEAVHVDHFIPWSRHPENAIENLVPAHDRCNSDKRDFLAATTHLRRWRERAERDAEALRAIAESTGFDHARDRVVSVARSIYVRLPGGARLWVRKGEFESMQARTVDEAFRRSSLT